MDLLGSTLDVFIQINELQEAVNEPRAVQYCRHSHMGMTTHLGPEANPIVKVAAAASYAGDFTRNLFPHLEGKGQSEVSNRSHHCCSPSIFKKALH